MPSVADHFRMAAFGVLSMIFGLVLMIVPLRPHPTSEAGRLTGPSRVAVKVLGVGTGLWSFLLGTALLGDDVAMTYGLIEVFFVLYLGVAGVTVLAMIVTIVGGARRSQQDRRPQDRVPDLQSTMD